MTEPAKPKENFELTGVCAAEGRVPLDKLPLVYQQQNTHCSKTK